MLRIIILFGFTYFFMMLHAKGDISKYINMKYSYLSFSMIFLMGFLTLYQLIQWARGDKRKDHNHDHDHDHGHDHSHDEDTILKKVFTYTMMLIPIITGIFLPAATLDSTIVKAKGFHFSFIDNDTDQYANHQILRPDASPYYDKIAYNQMDKNDLKKYGSENRIVLDDKHYFRALESIYNHPGNFIDKKVVLKGFAYRTDDIENNQLFVLRFGIIHCIADAGVYGMLVEFPKDVKSQIHKDEWLQVEGTLETTYYQPFKENIPYLKVTKWEEIPKPKDPYVYRQY